MGKGIYLPSSNLDSAKMVSCLQALLDAHPSIKFTSVNFDEKLRGFKVHFSEPDEAVVLENNFLTINNHHVWIYPLTTFLTVHKVVQFESSSFKSELKHAINERFGKLLDFTVIKRSPDSVDWRILIDIPEFKGLEVFHQETLPEMTISLPNWNEKLDVTFWCRHCEGIGHFQHECVRKSHPEISTENRKDAKPKTSEAKSSEVQSGKSTQSPPTSKSTPRNSTEKPEEFSKISQKSLDSYAEKIGREEILNSGIISEGGSKPREALKNEPTSSTLGDLSNILTEREIKKENDVGDERDIRSEKNGDRGNSIFLKQESPALNINENSFNSNDEDIVFLKSSSKSSPENASSHDSNAAGRDGAYNSDDVSRSPPDVKRDFSFPTFQETGPFSVTPDPPYRASSSSKPGSRVEVTTVLSDRLQDCINNACDTFKVLDRKTLDAFLIHVKKKSNPIRVALNFTKNANGLKDQLKHVLHLYYTTPQTGTKEDMQFIKWLNGLVERFDGTIPRKRKRNDQSSDRSPSKR